MKKEKYRGKRVDTGEWVFGSLLKIAGGCLIYHGPESKAEIVPDGDCESMPKDVSVALLHSEVSVVYPKSVGQLICVIPNTSMYVDNSHELYEDDLFTCDATKRLFRAVYDGFGAYFGYNELAFAFQLSQSSVRVKSGGIKVVGNYFDNPELLKCYDIPPSLNQEKVFFFTGHAERPASIASQIILKSSEDL